MELIDEQGKTDYDLRELEMGHKIRNYKKKSQINYEERIYDIVTKFDEFYRTNRLLDYLKILGCHITFPSKK